MALMVGTGNAPTRLGWRNINKGDTIMKFTITRPVEIDVAFIELILPIRYGTEDIPEDFPLRKGDVWQAVINIDTGTIEGWPQSETGSRELHMKVVDSGRYTLMDRNRKEIAKLDDYVPDIIPGRYGDYVELDIGPGGKISNWKPKNESIAEFFPLKEGR
jgi:hypothetical protein